MLRTDQVQTVGDVWPSQSASDTLKAAHVEPGRLAHRVGRSTLLVAVDSTMVLLAAATAVALWAAPVLQQPPAVYLELLPVIPLFVVGYARAGLYPGHGLGPVESLRRVTYTTIFVYGILAALSFALKVEPRYSRVTFLLAFVFSLLLVPIGRAALSARARRWWWCAEPVVIVGTGRRATRAIRNIRQNSHLGYRPAAVLTATLSAGNRDVEGVPIVGGLDQAPALSALGFRVALFEVDADHEQMRPVLDRLQQHFRHVILLQELDDLQVEGLQVRNLGSLAGIEYTNNLLQPANQMVKRILDIVVGTVALIILAPVIILAALAVLFLDGWPVFFYQDRRGLGAEHIRVPKIRTMRHGAAERLETHLDSDPSLREEWLTRFKLRNDPRLIPVIGRLFRRFSVDELPQLWAVVTGKMSLVGPRPFPDYHLDRFHPGFLDLRQRVRPGITGLWQVTVRSDGGLQEQEAFDTYYIRNWSIWFDVYLLARTTVVVASGRGAC